jgi:hypothetical protein
MHRPERTAVKPPDVLVTASERAHKDWDDPIVKAATIAHGAPL